VFLAAGAFFASVAEPLLIFARMPFHEFGHAIAAWISGHVAIPFPTFGFAWISSTQNRVFGALVSLCSMSTSALLARRGHFVWTFVSASVFLLQCKLTWLSNDARRQEAMLAGGILGECALAALFLLLFHAPSPRRARWDFWRYAVALPSAIVLCAGAFSWRDWSTGAVPLPMGGIIGEERDGDLARLVDSFGWSEALLRDAAGMLSALAFLAIFIALGLGIRHARRPH
jgi:hypothetical protein